MNLHHDDWRARDIDAQRYRRQMRDAYPIISSREITPCVTTHDKPEDHACATAQDVEEKTQENVTQEPC